MSGPAVPASIPVPLPSAASAKALHPPLGAGAWRSHSDPEEPDDPWSPFVDDAQALALEVFALAGMSDSDHWGQQPPADSPPTADDDGRDEENGEDNSNGDDDDKDLEAKPPSPLSAYLSKANSSTARLAVAQPWDSARATHSVEGIDDDGGTLV